MKTLILPGLGLLPNTNKIFLFELSHLGQNPKLITKGKPRIRFDDPVFNQTIELKDYELISEPFGTMHANPLDVLYRQKAKHFHYVFQRAKAEGFKLSRTYLYEIPFAGAIASV